MTGKKWLEKHWIYMKKYKTYAFGYLETIVEAAQTYKS